MSFKTDFGASDREWYAKQGLDLTPGIVVNINKQADSSKENIIYTNHPKPSTPIFSDKSPADAEEVFLFEAERYGNIIYHLEDVHKYLAMDSILRSESKYSGTLLCSRSLYREKCRETTLLPDGKYMSYEKFMHAFDDLLLNGLDPKVEGRYFSSFDLVCFGLCANFWPFWRYNISPKKANRIFNKILRKFDKQQCL